MQKPHSIDNDTRLAHEREHAHLLAENPEGIWGWQTPAGMVRARRRARLIIEAGRITKTCNTLEIGCGSGLFTQMVSQTGASITACELCPELLEFAYKKHYDSKVTFISEDASKLGPTHHNTYDVIWGSSILHHLDLDVFLPEMQRLFKPGGRLVFAEPNMMNPQIWLERNVGFIREMTGTSKDEMAFYRKRITRTLEQNDFVKVSVWPHEFLHPATPRWLIPAFEKMTRLAETLWPIREIAGSLLIKAEKPV